MARLHLVAALSVPLLLLPAMHAGASGTGSCAWCLPTWQDAVDLEPTKTFKKSFTVVEGEHYFAYMHISAAAVMQVSGDVETPDCEGIGEGEQVCAFKATKAGMAKMIVTAGSALPVHADLAFGTGTPPD